MPVELLYAWMMVFLRGLGIVMLLPTLGGRPLPVMVRVAISALIATLLYGLVPRVAALPPGNAGLIVSAMGEVVLGLVFGFVGRLIFSAVDMAGRVITQEIGLSAAPGIDAPAPSTEPLAAFLSTFAGVMFFLLGGHIGALSAFARSFDLAPAGAPAFSQLSIEHLVAGTARVIELGFRISAPFIAMNFLITLAFSVLGRAVPKMSVFILSFSLRVLVGFTLLAGSGALVARYLAPEFKDMPYQILEMVGR
ncbi:MAG: flagellar biosynthetic protein FliR [Verrucomicrobia bacterium]|nr:flagellar biosynthetic protein FliR [Verrucomicrobiota bacterium]